MSDHQTTFEVERILKRRVKNGQVRKVNIFLKKVLIMQVFAIFNSEGGIFVKVEKLRQPERQHVRAKRKLKLLSLDGRIPCKDSAQNCM